MDLLKYILLNIIAYFVFSVILKHVVTCYDIFNAEKFEGAQTFKAIKTTPNIKNQVRN